MSGGAFKNSSNLLGRKREMEELEEACKKALTTVDKIQAENIFQEGIFQEKSGELENVKSDLQKKYLEENLIRPNDESCKDVKGEVVLSFFVDKEGRPQNITVVHGLCESADKEAIRLVKEGPKWTSGDLPTRVTVEF